MRFIPAALRLCFALLLASLFLLYKQAPDAKKPSLKIVPFSLSEGFEGEDEEEEGQEAKYNEERARHEFEMLRNPVTGKIPDGIRKIELLAASKIPGKHRFRNNQVSGIIGMNDVENTTANNNYQSIGPENVAGRSRTLAWDRRNPDIMLTGGPTGGIFRSTDGGDTWNFVSPEADIRSANSIVQDLANPNVWYCGTGEAFYTAPANVYGFTQGHGIFKSTDNGVNWFKLTSTEGNPSLFDSPFDLAHRLAVHPTTGHIYAAVHRRIMRSTDGGQSWNVVLAGDSAASALSGITDVIIASNGSKIFAAVSGGNIDRKFVGVWESASGNVGTWRRIAGGVRGAADSVAGWRAYDLIDDETRQQGKWDRIVLALNTTNTKLFVLYKNDESSNGDDPKPEADLFRCDISSGNPATYTWTNLNAYVPDEPSYDQPNIDPYSTYFNGFAMSLAVKPDNDNILFIGGSVIHRVDLTKTNATQKFRRIGGYGAGFFPDDFIYPNHHPDVHGIYFLPGNTNQLFTASDGGIHKTISGVLADTVEWEPLVAGLQTVQYQTISISADADDRDYTVIGGTQDNGTLANEDPFNTNLHFQAGGGDGASSAVSNFVKTGNTWKQNYFVSVVQGTVYRLGLTYQYNPTTNQLRFVSNTQDNITPSDLEAESGQWLTLLVNDPDSSEHLYYNSNNEIYRTTKASTVTSTGWTKLTAVGTTVPSDEYFTSMAISKKINNNKYLFFGTDNGHIYRLQNPNTAPANTKPVAITPPDMLEGTYVSGIAVNPRNPDTVLAVVSNYDAPNIEVPNIFWTGNATSATPTWRVLDGALASMSTQSCEIVVKTTGVEYYVGTSVGLYSTTAINDNSTQWFNEGSGILKTAIVRALKNRQQDNIMVVGTHGNGAFITNIGSPVVISDVVTGIDEPITNDKLFIKQVLPTVTTNAVQYRIGNLFTVKKISVRVFNLKGQLVFQESRAYQNGMVDLTPLARGQYILSIYSDDKKYRHIQKLIRQ